MSIARVHVLWFVFPMASGCADPALDGASHTAQGVVYDASGVPSCVPWSQFDCARLQVGQSICSPCGYAPYTIRTGDTCASIANTWSTSPQPVGCLPSCLRPGSYNCNNLQVGQALCVPYPPYSRVVQPGDTCRSLGIR